jgi:hypothetical protein
MLWLAAQFDVHVTLDLVAMLYNSTCLPKSSYVFLVLTGEALT